VIQKILSFFTAVFLSFFVSTKNISPLVKNISPPSPSPMVQVTPISTPVLIPIPTTKIPSVLPIADTGPWGIAEQIGEHTWTMKIEQDSKMATPQEIFQALNEYRRLYGSSVLIWDQNLADYAQTRAKFFTDKHGLDSHQGFQEFLENDNGFQKLGFTSLGENASYGYRLNGTHLIEWIYAGDEPHDQNQKNSRWAYVGIGVNGTSTCLIFATGKT
jgi:uncharacterized protein YkwD